VFTSAADFSLFFRGLAISAAILAVGCGFATTTRVRTLIFSAFFHRIPPGLGIVGDDQAAAVLTGRHLYAGITFVRD
jgi:hypothetical protein